MNMIYLIKLLAFLTPLVVKAEWEWPFEFGFDLGRVIYGYPSYLFGIYEDLINGTYRPPTQSLRQPKQLFTSEFRARKFPWTCTNLNNIHECYSQLTSKSCTDNPQYSYMHWINPNSSSTVTCEKNQQTTNCETPKNEGQICENVATIIRNHTTNVHFVLSDVTIPSEVLQIFEKYPPSMQTNCTNLYEYGSLIEADFSLTMSGADSNGHCNSVGSDRIRFGQNISTSCTYRIQENVQTDDLLFCSQMQQTLSSLLDINATRICNCGDCSTMILRSSPPIEDINSTACLVPTKAMLSFVHHNGFINGARLQMQWIPLNDNVGILTLQKVVTFLPYFSDKDYQKSRFDLQRGRFHCPSEMSCPLELFYPLGHLTELSRTTQIAIAAFCIIISLLLSFRK